MALKAGREKSILGIPSAGNGCLTISVPVTTHGFGWHTQEYMRIPVEEFKLTSAKPLIVGIRCGWDRG
jgi:hypothetical protein